MSTHRDRDVVSGIIPWVGATALIGLAVIALYLFTGAAATRPSTAAPVAASDITFGPAGARVTVIEYSDFQCPFCAEYATWMRRLREKYGDRARFVFRNLPLAKHRWATLAARVAYAASLQGRFWEMHDLLYQRQEEWADSTDPRPLFESYARSLELDMQRFRDDADAQSTLEFVRRQAAEGQTAGVTHTPWFVVNGESVLPRSLEQFERLIEERLR